MAGRYLHQGHFALIGQEDRVLPRRSLAKTTEHRMKSIEIQIREDASVNKDGGNLLDGKKLGEALSGLANDLGKFTTNVADQAKNAVTKSQESVISVIDANGNGQVDIEDIIILGLQVPGVGINRREFLQREFFKKFPQEMIDDAIANTPALAQIPSEAIDKIADDVIQYERNCVSGISAALGAPGGFAMVATIPADIIQYYGYMLRVAQKLMYLYGFPEIDTATKGQKFDSETINILIVCLGVMYGAAGANNAMKAMAKALATGVERKLVHAALTKGTIYPIVKNVASWFGKKMTKDIFAGFFRKTIPVLGGVLGGSVTYFSFKPCCDKLQASLQNTLLSNPNYRSTAEENVIVIADIQEA